MRTLIAAVALTSLATDAIADGIALTEQSEQASFDPRPRSRGVTQSIQPGIHRQRRCVPERLVSAIFGECQMAGRPRRKSRWIFRLRTAEASAPSHRTMHLRRTIRCTSALRPGRRSATKRSLLAGSLRARQYETSTSFSKRRTSATTACIRAARSFGILIQRFLVALGDRYHHLERAQQPNDYYGVVVRLDESGKPAATAGIAIDGAAAGVRSYGHRNIQGFARDPAKR